MLCSAWKVGMARGGAERGAEAQRAERGGRGGVQYGKGTKYGAGGTRPANGR